MNQIIRALTVTLLLVLASVPGFAQNATTYTTLNGAITTPTSVGQAPGNSVTLTSGTGVVANSWLIIDSELMQVTSVANTPTFAVSRQGQGGTVISPHLNGAAVWMVLPSAPGTMTTVDPAGGCTPSQWQYLPIINIRTGTAWYCNPNQNIAATSAYEWGGFTIPHTDSRLPFTQIGVSQTAATFAYTIKVTDAVVMLTTTATGSGSLAAAINTLTLPSHIGLHGKKLVIKDGSGGVTATTFIALSGTIDNVPTTTLGVFLKTAYGGIQLIAGSGGWFTISCYRSLLCQ